jgi:four helix bundle protein
VATRSDDPALLTWEQTQPRSVTEDAVWRLDCYREALFLLHVVRFDLARPVTAKVPRASADQLLTSVASIGANIAEGYGRSTNADRARFLSYALGSAREAVIWYQAVLRPEEDHLLHDRLDRLARMKRMLLGLLGRIRRKTEKPFDRW